MSDFDPRRVALAAVVVLAIVVVGARQMGGGGEARPAAGATLPVAPAAAPDASERGGTGDVTVHVAGAVAHPGVYRLRKGERVDDAVRRAGGAGRRADLSAVNLAAVLEDGRQILVPTRAPAGAPPAPGAVAGPSAKVNLNTATAEQLDTLAGVGPATAAKILAFREEHGGFGSVEELADVPGIGERRLEALRDLVTV